MSETKIRGEDSPTLCTAISRVEIIKRATDIDNM
jgi:hypothetical protein